MSNKKRFSRRHSPSPKKSKKRKRKFIPLPSEIQQRVNELMKKNGLAFPFALAVARGKMTLPQALSEMLRKQKVDEVARKHRLPRALAGQVVAKKMTLEEAKGILKLNKMQQKFRKKSCFQDSFRRKEVFVLHCHTHLERIGIVVKNDPYDIDWQEEGKEELLRIPKLEVKFSYPKRFFGQVKIETNEEVKGKKLGPIKRVVERFRIKDSLLKQYFLKGVPVQFTTLEGDVLTGKVQWFNLYEIGLKQEKAELYLLRHALYSWEELE